MNGGIGFVRAGGHAFLRGAPTGTRGGALRLFVRRLCSGGIAGDIRLPDLADAGVLDTAHRATGSHTGDGGQRAVYRHIHPTVLIGGAVDGCGAVQGELQRIVRHRRTGIIGQRRYRAAALRRQRQAQRAFDVDMQRFRRYRLIGAVRQPEHILQRMAAAAQAADPRRKLGAGTGCAVLHAIHNDGGGLSTAARGVIPANRQYAGARVVCTAVFGKLEGRCRRHGGGRIRLRFGRSRRRGGGRTDRRIGRRLGFALRQTGQRMSRPQQRGAAQTYQQSFHKKDLSFRWSLSYPKARSVARCLSCQTKGTQEQMVTL